MNNQDSENRDARGHNEMMSAMFANLVIQNTNMASIFLGHVPHPETGQVSIDLEHARYFIDQLEMLEAKTKGNLNKQEETLLKQSLTTLRMAFVEAASKKPEQAAPKPAPAPEPVKAREPAAPAQAGEPQTEDPKKKFSKRY
jgi:hypothetical protein